MMTWSLELISRSRSDSATMGLGKSGYQSALRRRLLELSVHVWWHPYRQQTGTAQRASLRFSARGLEPGTW